MQGQKPAMPETAVASAARRACGGDGCEADKAAHFQSGRRPLRKPFARTEGGSGREGHHGCRLDLRQAPDAPLPPMYPEATS